MRGPPRVCVTAIPASLSLFSPEIGMSEAGIGWKFVGWVPWGDCCSVVGAPPPTFP